VIYDCFSFFNELELLDIRLHELSDVVDYFVLVEATKTHTGLDKPLYYKENAHLFKNFTDRIIHVIVEDMPITPQEVDAALSSQDRHWLESGYQLGDNWVRERFQRNAMMRALDEYCAPDDIVIISDADEIVRASVIRDIENTIVDGSNAVEQTLNTYYINWQCTNMPWWGSKILRYRCISTPSEDRFHTPAAQYIRNGGWHFGFLGGADKIREKIKSYAHQEFMIPEVLDNIEYRLQSQKDVLGRSYQYQVVPLDDHFPKYILENLEKFNHLIYHE